MFMLWTDLTLTKEKIVPIFLYFKNKTNKKTKSAIRSTLGWYQIHNAASVPCVVIAGICHYTWLPFSVQRFSWDTLGSVQWLRVLIAPGLKYYHPCKKLAVICNRSMTTAWWGGGDRRIPSTSWLPSLALDSVETLSRE